MGCGPWSKAPRPSPLNNPRIQVRPRHQLASLGPKERDTERDRLIVRICQKRIDFKEGSSAFSEHSEEVLRNIAEVFLEYPELNLEIESHAGCSKGKRNPDKEKEHALVQYRAEACRERLVELGVLSDLGLSVCQDGDADPSALEPAQPSSALGAEPFVVFRAEEAKLMAPQERLDYLLSRTGFDFIPKSAELSEKGIRVADVISRVLKETANRIIIAVPKMSSELALQRAQAIAEGIQDFSVSSEISVEIAKGAQKYATVRIEEDEPEDMGPQGQLAQLLKETPLAFRMNSSELAPEVLPTVRKCADVLKQVKDMSVLIEAYSGVQRYGESAEARIQEIMLRRAERVAAWLQAEGVELPLLTKGYAAPFMDGPISARGAARVVLTLINPEERELVPVDATDAQEVDCMGQKFNILGCL